MKYIVYLTTDLKNNKIYVGVHKTEDENIFDGYIGCGVNIFSPSSYKKSKTAFQFAVNQYGVKNFKRWIIAIFDNDKDAYNLEEKIVTNDFIKRPDVYNMIPGGDINVDVSVTVYQYDMNGYFIKEWHSYKDIAKKYKCSSQAIENAVKNCYSSNKFYWSTEKVCKLDMTKYSNGTKRDGYIFEYDKSGKRTSKYSSTKEIAIKYNISIGEINRAIQGCYLVKDKYYSLLDCEKFIPTPLVKIKNKKVYLYNENGEFVKEYNTPLDCARDFGDKTISKISSAIRLNRLYNGYQVSLEKLDCMKLFKHKNGKMSIEQYDLNGNFIKKYNSLAEAINIYGQGVRRCVKGQQTMCKNFVFKKVNDIV